MEQALVHLAETAAWVFFILVLFAAIGVYATVRWIINLVTKAEHAVVDEVRTIEEKITLK
jgi:hypothetical protein